VTTAALPRDETVPGRPSGIGPCAFCGGSAVAALEAEHRDQEVSDERFRYRRCLVCDSLSLIDVPTDLGRFYSQQYYVLPKGAELDLYAEREADKLTRVRALVEPGRLIEIGPGTGAFAHAARRAGFDVTVVELDERVCEHLRTEVEVRAVHSSDPAAALAEEQPARAVVMWHVIEHLPDPAAALAAAAAVLEPGGVLAVSTPNPGSLQFRLLKARWLHLDAPRHLLLMPLEAVTRRLAEAGLRRVEVTTSDPLGQYCNRGGWERALVRRRPTGLGSRAVPLAATLIELALRPVEGKGLRGSTYTALFVKDGHA
jgi:2-polyprenyl-3-methyl-5-hydroxy-6-metoxy-1,4-benzoquinol methylase